MSPLILLSGGAGTNPSGRPLCGVPDAYAMAVTRAGGLPVLALSDDGEAYAARCDGLLLTGGVDADPALYGETPLSALVETEPARDRREKALFDAFLAAGRPIFGICRGVQMLTVFLGGTLWQDLPSQRGLSHSGDVSEHTVQAAPEHWLHALLEASFPANSFHHQAIRDLPPELHAVAWSSDGVVEAVESVNGSVWGVQWHPERLPDAPGQAALFERFVEQCRNSG